MRELTLHFLISSTTLPFLPAFQSVTVLLSFDGSGCIVPHNIICWNFTQSAGYYSQFAGVLAGFVFIAINLLLTPSNTKIQNDPIRKQARTITLYSLFVTFFSLLISSFLFAVIAGEQNFLKNRVH